MQIAWEQILHGKVRFGLQVDLIVNPELTFHAAPSIMLESHSLSNSSHSLSNSVLFLYVFISSSFMSPSIEVMRKWKLADSATVVATKLVIKF